MNPAELNLNPLSQIDPVVMVAVAFIVIVTYVLLRRVFVLPYMHAMEAREDLFETARSQFREVDRLTVESQAACETAIAQATAQAEDLRAEAQERAAAYRSERVAEASRQASEMLETGRAKIEAERAEQMSGVRSQAVECVTAACTQLVGSVSADTVENAVDRLLERKTR